MKTTTRGRMAVAALAMLASWSAAAADEVADLIARVKPPARFADHRPEFSVAQEDRVFLNADGGHREPLWVIRDGQRLVALYSPTLGHLELFTHDPAQGQAKLNVGPRYHLPRLIGTRVSTRIWLAPLETFEYNFGGSGRALKLVETNRWQPSGRQALGVNVESNYTLTLRLDPVCGYTIDMDCRLLMDKIPNGKDGKPLASAEWCNLLAGHVSDVWPGRARYDKTVFSQLGLPVGRYRGWWNNLAASDHSDDDATKMRVREDGFVAFLADKDGWGPALVCISPHEHSLATGNVWQDQRNILAMPAEADLDGKYRMSTRFRLVFLPPEVTAEVLKNTAVDDFQGARAVMVRIGVLEDFEDQPLPLTTPVRGGYPVGEVTTDQAHSGKKSLLVKGSSRAQAAKGMPGSPLAPQILLDENSTYRITCWIKVDGDGEASVSADLYDSTPQKPERFVRQRTTLAKWGEEWKQVSLEFKTPAFDPFIDLRFVCLGAGPAYFDDFCLVKVEAGK